MKLSSCIMLRHVWFLIFLMFVVVSLAGFLIPLWINKVKRIENEVKLMNFNINEELHLGIQKTAKLLSPFNASTINLARVLSSSLDEKELEFSTIESKVASPLFQALSTIPYTSEISYIGLNGLFFAYYTKENQPYALYSNSTFLSTQKGIKNQTWYIQRANRDSGKLYGEAIKHTSYSIVNSSWFQSALNTTYGSYASVGTVWGDSQDIVLRCTAGMNRRGAISLGFSMKSITDFLTTEVDLYNGSLYLATKDGNVLVEGIPNTRMILVDDQISIQLLGANDDRVYQVGNITCQPDARDSILSIWDKKYVVKCSQVEIEGLQLVYVLALPHNDLSSRIHKNIKLAFVFLILMIGAMVITICTFMYLIIGAGRREMYLCGALIKQMEATQQAERKSMNKSLAFASAGHDIRASLAGINGLIEICLNTVSKRDPLRSEFQTNLLQMGTCTRDLLGILNSILDTSKIEAGKMQLEDEEFDIEQLVEDVVDLYHPVGMKKGVDVILDPYDGSVKKYSCVKGDRGKLKQILSNLLSNAVKFTSDGYVTVRVWARKPVLENEILASSGNNNTVMNCLLCLVLEVPDDKEYSESEVVNTIQRDPNCMEFVFEVNDTGRGIPKEKQKSVFENYVQVRETTALGHEGTGLGLGIVQSLVRLMGGEIGIVEKDIGEKGTCFKFNVFLSTCETDISTQAREAELKANGDYFISSDSFRHSGPSTRTHSPKPEEPHVLLFIQSAKRSSILQNFMQRLGIKVHIVTQHDQLSPTLKKIKHKLYPSGHSSSGASSTRSKEVPLSSLEGTDNISHTLRKPNARGGLNGSVLIVIDTRAGPFREISRAVAEFRRDLDNNSCSRVLWLYEPSLSNTNFQGLDEDKLPSSDLIMSKPLHGSRLYQAIGLLPKFHGMVPPRRLEINSEKVGSFEAGTSGVKGKFPEESFANKKEEIEGPTSEKPLKGKTLLVADDDLTGRKVASFMAQQLGASIFSCKNGQEAWELVCRSLDNGTKVGTSMDSRPFDCILIFDCILMDCQMPLMDGTEATRRIREEEKKYGVRIPIIALTAHTKGEEIDRMIQAGVDGYITKPLNMEKLLRAISKLIVKT